MPTYSEQNRDRFYKRRPLILGGDLIFLVRGLALLSLIMMGGMITGCSTPPPKKHVTWKLPFWKDKPQEAGSMTTVWENVYFPAEGKRGLRGHVLFFSDKKKNIKIDGMLSVYVFDDSTKELEGVKPNRIFRFRPEVMKLHEIKTDVGYTYVFWLPFDKIDGEEMNLTLLTRFDGVKGDRPEPAVSPIMLVGTPRQKDVAEVAENDKSDHDQKNKDNELSIQQVGYTTDSGKEKSKPSKLKSYELEREREDVTLSMSPGLSQQILRHVSPEPESPVTASLADTGFGGGENPVADWRNPGVGPQPFEERQQIGDIRDRLQQRMQSWGQFQQQTTTPQLTQQPPSQQPIQHVSHVQPDILSYQQQIQQLQWQLQQLQQTQQQFLPQQPTSQPLIPQSSLPQGSFPTQGNIGNQNYQPQPRMNMSSNQQSYTQGMLQRPGLTQVDNSSLQESPNTKLFLGPPGAGARF